MQSLSLLSSPIYRLKKTFAALPKASQTAFYDIQKLMDPYGSYSHYRTAISSTNPPAIPFLGIIMQDVTFICDGNPDYLGDVAEESLNFSKRCQLYRAITPFLRFQPFAYQFHDDVVSSLSDVQTLTRYPYHYHFIL